MKKIWCHVCFRVGNLGIWGNFNVSIFEIVQEDNLKCSKLISLLSNKKSSLNQNVRCDHATMQQDVLLHFGVIFWVQLLLGPTSSLGPLLVWAFSGLGSFSVWTIFRFNREVGQTESFKKQDEDGEKQDLNNYLTRCVRQNENPTNFKIE